MRPIFKCTPSSRDNKSIAVTRFDCSTVCLPCRVSQHTFPPLLNKLSTLPDDSGGTETYVLQTTPMTWRDAQSFCRQHHTDLVSVKTEEQNQKVFLHANGNPIWIGLSRDYWKWSDNRSTSFRNWRKGQPDNARDSEHCAVLVTSSRHQWNDDSCGRLYPFVCHGGEFMGFDAGLQKYSFLYAACSGSKMNFPCL